MHKYFLSILLLPFYNLLIGQTTEDTVAYSIDLDDYVITAQHKPTHYTQALHHIEVIDDEIIASIGATNLEQVIAVNPSVRLIQDPILGTSIRMRGVKANNVAILLDGVPVIGRLGGAIDLSQLSMQNVDRIEIVQGPLSYLYGSNAAAGVINIISKKSQVKTWKVDLESQLESIKQYKHQANIGFHKNKWTAEVYGRYFNYQQYPMDSLRLIEKVQINDSTSISRSKYPYNPKKQYNLGGMLRYDFNEEHHLVAKFDQSKEEVMDFGIVRRAQWNPYSNDQIYITHRDDIKLQYIGTWNKSYIEATGAYNQYNRYREKKRRYLETNTFDSLLQSTDTTYFKSAFGKLNVTHPITDKLSSTFGVQYNHESGGGDRIVNRENSDSTYASFYEIAPYIDLKYNWSKNLSLGLASRFIAHEIYDNKWIGSLHAKYNINDQLSLRASYAQGYRSPSLKELYMEFIDINHYLIGNAKLQPETSHDWQATISYTPNKQWDLSLNSYYLDIKDHIGFAAFEPFKYRYENISQYSVYGFQPEVSWSRNNVEVNTSISLGFNSIELTHEAAPSYARLFNMNNSLRYQWGESGLSTFINHRYTGDQPRYDIDRNAELQISKTKGYHLLDASVNYRWRFTNWTIGMRNITNVKSTDSNRGGGGAHGGGSRSLVSVGRSAFIKLNITL